MEITLEMVEQLRQHVPVSYAQAKQALEHTGGDLLDAAFGAGFSRPETLRYPKHILSVCSYLFARHVDSRRCFRAAVRLAQWVLQAVPAERFVAQKENGEPDCIAFMMFSAAAPPRPGRQANGIAASRFGRRWGSGTIGNIFLSTAHGCGAAFITASTGTPCSITACWRATGMERK